MLGLTFLTPVAALVGLVGALPLAALGARAAARSAHGARAPVATSRARRLGRPRALVLLSALLALAAAQPVRAHTVKREVRTDAAALYVLDTSLSMRAASSPHAPDRLAQARRIALAMQAALPDIPAGVASFTDRVLPDLFPTADTAAFASTVTDAVAIDAPPPRDENTSATTFAALGEAAHSGFFPKAATRRVLIVVTDGESRAFDAAGLARTLASHPATRLVAIRVGSSRRPHLAGREGRPGVHAGGGCAALAQGAHERDRHARERPRRRRARRARGARPRARGAAGHDRRAPRARALPAGARARAAGCAPARAQRLVIRSATTLLSR